jgi:hypothetical protein
MVSRSTDIRQETADMWRSFFLAVGIFLCILGVESLAVDRAVLSGPSSAGGAFQSPGREFTPPEWAPWTLMSCGAVVLLYSFTIPRRMGGA